MLRNMLARFGLFFQQYSIGQRLVVFFVPVVMISMLIVLLLWANKPTYEPLFTDINPSMANDIIESLKSDGIKYKIENRGRSILVEKSKASELRIKYSDVSNNNTSQGYGIFDKANIGMTQFMQKVSMKIAQEGELTKTLESYAEIKAARVQLVIGDESLFNKNNNGSASVTLQIAPGYYLSPDQIRGIAVTIANAVDGIDENDVSIVDTRGGILFNGQDEVGKEDDSDYWAIQRNISKEKELKVQNMLNRIVGINNSTVSVSVDINFEKLDRTSEKYDTEDVAIVSEEQVLESGTRPDSSSFSNQNTVTNYELSKTIEHYSSQPNIQRLTVAVNVDGMYETNGEGEKSYLPRPTADMNYITSLVKQAVGYDESRGDVITVSNVKFDRSKIEEDKLIMAGMQKSALIESWTQRGILFLIIGAMIYFVMKLMKSVNGESVLVLQSRKKTTALGSGNTTASLKDRTPEEEEVDFDEFMQKLSPDARAKLKAKDQMANDISEFVTQAPEDAANLVRSWIAESTSLEIENAKSELENAK